jgi:hypothetical protein
MPAIADRVKDTTTSTGTGAITLANTAPLGFRTFAVAFGSASLTVGYCIQDATTGAWEVGDGTFNGTTSLTRDNVRSSSNSGNLVSFAAGSKDVFCTASAQLLNNSNLGMQYAMARGFAMP